MMPKSALFSVCCAALLVLSLAVPGRACTGMFAKAEDGGVVYARSMEFDTQLKSELLLLPRETACAVALPNGAKGAAWKTKYGILGMNAFGLRHYVDAMNEKGLQMGLFWFPAFAEYADYDPQKASSTLTPWEMVEFVLGQCATVKEARERLQHVNLVAFPSKELGGGLPTAHFWMVDASGDSLVAEPVGKKLVFSSNPVGVFTNAPTFDWHLVNLSNYGNLGPQQAAGTTLGKRKVLPLGNGLGMRGLPGDITPPSRFVRAAYYLNSLYPLKTTADALASLMRLHQTFFITKGIARPTAGTSGPDEVTQWEIYTDLKHHKFYYRTYDNLAPRMVDAAKLDYSPGKPRVLPLDQPQTFKDMTGAFK